MKWHCRRGQAGNAGRGEWPNYGQIPTIKRAIALASAGALVIPAAASGATVTVDSDSGAVADGVCGAVAGDCTFNDAISVARNLPGTDSIEFDASISGTITLAAIPPKIDHDVDFRGPGEDVLAIDGAGQFALSFLEGTESSISELTFQNMGGVGYLSNYGGAIAVDRATLALQGVTITGSSPDTGDGGAIWADQSELTISDTSLVGNSVPQSSSGGAIWAQGSTVSLYAGEVSGNEAPGDQDSGSDTIGGAVYVADSSLLAEGTRFYENTVADRTDAFGGAIAARGGSTVSLDGTEFEGNHADTNYSLGFRGLGGALFADGFSEVTITDAQFIDNIADGAGSSGGALHLEGQATLSIENSTFSGNTAEQGGVGGAIGLSNVTAGITGTTFYDNNADGLDSTGGAISARVFSTVRISDSEFENNRTNSRAIDSADGGASGGAIRVGISLLEIERSTLHANTVRGKGPLSGAAIHVIGSAPEERDGEPTLSVKNSTISGNSVLGPDGTPGAAITVEGSYSLGPGHINAEIVDSTIAGNRSTDGEGVSLEASDGDPEGTQALEVQNSIIADNVAVADNADPNDDSDADLGRTDPARHTVAASNSLVEVPEAGIFTAASTVITGQDPALAALADNGGGLPTMAIDQSSPAFNAGLANAATDQRGVLRTQGGADDIGSFELDVAPAVSIDSAPSGATRESSPQVAFSSPDPDLARFECSLDGGPFSVCTSPFRPGALADGDHSITIRAFDSSGQSASETVNFTIDTEVTDADVTAKKKQKQGGKKVKIKLKGGAQENVSGVAKGKISAGKKSFKLKTVKKSTGPGQQTVYRLTLKKKKDNKKVLKLLKKGKKVKSNPSVKLTDAVGNSVTEKRVVRLKAKK